MSMTKLPLAAAGMNLGLAEYLHAKGEPDGKDTFCCAGIHSELELPDALSGCVTFEGNRSKS
ncbi:hypothetical protein [Streptomyces coeruleorubidus]|uniref:hypothetical protein n=1 Tax=Streptomyces coeruleorubidus TaxID=116188 RepID=UPI00379C32AD